jgi:drug/metabolite transporter (DMT)-like permease
LNHSAATPRVTAALILVQVLFGIHYYAAKVVLLEIPPRAWAFVRVAAAALLLLPLAVAFAGRRSLPRGADLARLAGLSVFGVVINQLCFVEGLSRTTPSHSSLINCSIPVLTLVLAMLFRQERAAPRKLFSITLALAGVLALLRIDEAVWDPMTVGDLLTVVNATSFSLFLVLSRPVLARLDAFVATGLLFAFGAVVMLPVSFSSVATVDPGALSWPVLGWAVYIVLGATVLAYSLNYAALRRVESSMVALFIFLQPLLAAALDIWLLDGRWTGRLAVSGTLILAGVAMALLGGKRRPVTPVPRGA